MSDSTKPREQLQATSAAQQGDNIAHALAGAGGGLLSMTLTYPLITLSTRAQVESKRAHTSTLDAVRHIIQREGFSGLYSGLESALFGISVTNFVYYYWYEWTRSFFERAAQRTGRASKKLTALESMIAGAIAGSATVVATNPIWVVNTRMTARQSSTSSPPDEESLPGSSAPRKRSPSTLDTLRALLRDEGFGALFAGVLPALVLVINPILQYTIFEQLKNALERRRKTTSVGARDAFLLGALGKLAATGLTYPYITVKSRAHVAKKDGGEKGQEGGGSGSGKGLLEGLRKVVREEGWGGLYGGVGPKLTQSVLTAAFLFAFKDALYEASVRARRRRAKVAA
ncbi:MAG: hypothetical protein LQ340_002016 [Diploschistes diacapsis]|nr:MAG: hypothetical protein LQ340_002016 [Diploschistes diacapsis]